MKLIKPLLFALFISFLTTSCFEDIDDNEISASAVNDFVWKGMNSWYYWQPEVPNLSDTKDDNLTEYANFLNETNSPETFFNSLRFQFNTTDRFSWFVENYIEQQQEFQGISKSHGLEYQFVQINNNGDVIGYVKYVADNSPASSANIKRGDILNAINGTILNINNFDSVVSGLYNDTVTLSFVTENSGTLTFLETKTITAAVVFENPIYLQKIFNTVNGKKVGYLVYNGFRSSYNDELNNVFSFFKSEGIDELILDLRLNGGGSVATSAYLASMIYANAGTETFASLQFNAKHTTQNRSYPFSNTLAVFDSNDTQTDTQAINRLNTLNRLYVLTSINTASASEMVINGLKPYMNSIKLVGTTTYGKNVGSITLYDSPKTDFTNSASANPNHLNAMQPIVFKIFNKNNESNYTQGFEPDIEVNEFEFWNNILPFGDENEVVLNAALNDIRNTTSKIQPSTKKKEFTKPLEFKNPNKKFETEMFIDGNFLNN